MSAQEFFKPENAKSSSEHLSPSGEYRLKITNFSTREGAWDYTQGLVYRGEELLFEVRRNYSSFVFSWIEDHPNKHTYLLCGESYMGQTVLELDTGKRRDYLPEEARRGGAFCWITHRFDPGTSILVVEGCYWACSYEFKFFDFSDPMNGWPEIEAEVPTSDDRRWPTFEADGTIHTYETQEAEDDEDPPEEDTFIDRTPVVVTKVFRREGLKLSLVEERMTEEERERRRLQEEASKKWREWFEDFKASDPLYLRVFEELKMSNFKHDVSVSVGTTYEGWCPDFKGSETRICHRINRKPAIDLEWGAKTGPVKLTLWGKKAGDICTHLFFMDHTPDSISEAFTKAREYVGGAL